MFNSAKAFAAVADAVTALASIPAIESEYAFIDWPNGTNWAPNSDKESPPPKNFLIPSRIPAPVMAKIIAPIELTAVTLDSSIPLMPSKNGFKLLMKFDKFVPTCGSDSLAVSNPDPIIDPTNPPIALPICCKNAPPSAASHSAPGICLIAPAANTIAAITPITPAIATAPAIAAGAAAPTTVNIAVTADIASSNIDKDAAVSIEG